MTRLIKLLFLTLLASGAMADDLPALIAYSCDSKTSAFSVDAEAEIDPDLIHKRELLLRADHNKRTVNWRKLIQWGPQRNGRGDFLRTGTKKLSISCGKLTIHFQAGYLNDNIQGQYGALEFPVVEVMLESRTLLKPTALATCSMRDTYTTYFGACPAHWAVSVQTRPLSKNTLAMSVTRGFTDSSDTDMQTVEHLKFHY